MTAGLTLFDVCNTKAKSRVIELLVTCDKTENCKCRFCTGEYFKTQERLKQKTREALCPLKRTSGVLCGALRSDEK